MAVNLFNQARKTLFCNRSFPSKILRLSTISTMNRPKVFVTRSNCHEIGIEMLRKKFDVELYSDPETVPADYLKSHIKGASALFCLHTDQIDKAVLDAAGPQLKIVATHSQGFEHIDLEECRKRNIVVSNAPNPASVSGVAEFAVGLLLAVSRKIVQGSGAVKRGEWTEAWDIDWYAGRGLANATVGIVGMGRVGQEILHRILPFGVSKVLYYDIFHPIKEAESEGAHFACLKELLQPSDFVISACNLTEESRDLFDKKAFSLMKNTAVFVNIGRGGVVNQEDLITALKENQIKAAGLDVMYPEPLPGDHELLTLKNLVVTPHLAGKETAALDSLSSLTAENIIEVLEGRQAITPVF